MAFLVKKELSDDHCGTIHIRKIRLCIKIYECGIGSYLNISGHKTNEMLLEEYMGRVWKVANMRVFCRHFPMKRALGVWPPQIVPEHLLPQTGSLLLYRCRL